MTALRDRRAARDAALEYGDLARVCDVHDPCWGMTGVCEAFVSGRVVLSMTSWGIERDFAPSQLVLVRGVDEESAA